MARLTVIALAACAVLAFGCNRPRNDATLNAAVMAQIDKEPTLSTAIVHSRTEEGHVYLTGRVMTPEQRRRAEDVADDVHGVKGVTNDIEVSAATGSQNPSTQPAPSNPSAPAPAEPAPSEQAPPSPSTPPPGATGNEPPSTTPMPTPPEQTP
jgi:BON domain-containing protein